MGHQLQRAIQQVQAVVVSRRANRQIGATGRCQINAEERHVIRAFRRAISVHQTDLRVTQQPLVRQFRRHRLTGGQHPAQAVEADAVLGQHALDQRRYALQHGNALCLNVGQQTLGIVGDGVRHDVHPRAEQRRGEELPYGNVETLRRGLRDHVRRAQVQVRQFAQLVIEHAALLDHHAFGQARGARGVDHIGEVVRATVDAWVLTTSRHFFPHQQLAVKTVEQLNGLLAACFGAHQQRRTAHVDDAAQALAWQARVQRQVTRTGLEAADDHAQQVEVTLGQQGHRLIQADTRRDQCMAQAVAAAVEFVIGPLLFQVTGGDPLRMLAHLRFEQLDIAKVQRIDVCALVAAFNQEFTLLFANQRQVGHVAMEPLHQRQQQALELAEHVLHGGFVEVTLVVRQVQAQVIAGVAHGGQREVSVGAAGIRGGIQALCAVQHRGFHRGVFEHEQAVEQRLAFRQFAVFLDGHQWQVFVLAQLHVAVEQAVQPLAHAATLTVFRQLYPQRDAVDKQADGALHLRHFHRTPGDGDAEQHVAIAAQAAQHQGPCRLGKGVDGELVGLCQFTQLRAIAGIKTGVAVAHHHAAAVARMFAQERAVARDRRGALKALQVLLPPLARFIQVLTLQPGDVVAITRRRGQLRVVAFAQGHVDLEKVIHQQRTAPRIDKDVVVAHHEPVACFADADQAQVERRLVEQIEAGFTLGLEQRLQTRLLLSLGIVAPVQVFNRRAAGFVDHLQHVFANVPAERGTQGFMTGDHRLPGLGETLRVQGTVDAVAVLHVVQTGARLQQSVKQQALLHRSQRVHVFDGTGRDRQAVELRLGQFRQGEVGRCETTGIILEAMGDQAVQLGDIGLGQLADGVCIVALTAEGPAQHQLTAIHLAVDAQGVGQRRIRVMGQARRLIQRVEQRLAAEALVELAEVVEGDVGGWQRGHGLLAQVVRQVAQHAIAQPFVGYRPQLLFDRLDRGALPGRFFDLHGRQAQWIGTGEPADTAGQVDLIEQGFAAMAFQLDQRRVMPAPAAQHAGQGGQQQVIDLGAVCAWGLLQQLTGVFGIQAHADRVGIAIAQRALCTVHRQRHRRARQVVLPHAQFFTQGFAAGISLQARGPVTQGAGLGRQADGLALAQLAIHVLQVFEQHTPRHAVHHQVMNRDQQALLAFGAIHQQGAQQRAVFKVEAALGVGEQRGALGHIAHLRLHQHAALGHGQMFGMPLRIAPREAQAQGVVVLQHRQQRLLQAMGFEQLQRLEDQRLVPVLTRRDLGVKEPMLDRREARAAGEYALLRRDLLGARGHGGQGLHRLVLEQVAGAEMNSCLPRTADHLDRQDGVAAQLKEIIVQADLLHVQHRTPDRGQGAFQFVARGYVLLAIGLGVRLRQGTAVELAVGGQRHTVEHDQVRGHHVVRQLRLEMRLQRLAQWAVLCVADQVRHELFAARRIQRQHHRFAHSFVLQQAGFDLAQFYTETTDFHLMVDTPQVLHQTIGALAH